MSQNFLIAIEIVDGLLQGPTISLRDLQDLHTIAMAQEVILLITIIIFENVVLHFFVSSFRIFIVIKYTSVLKGLADHRINNGLLIFRHGVKYILNGLVIAVVSVHDFFTHVFCTPFF